LLDELHCRVGERVASQWNLPQSVQACCAHYRRYAQAPVFSKEATMAYLSNRLAAWLLQCEPITDTALIADQAFAHLNFYPDEVQALLERQENVLSVVQAIGA
jgi:hypothetical protein